MKKKIKKYTKKKKKRNSVLGYDNARNGQIQTINALRPYLFLCDDFFKLPH